MNNFKDVIGNESIISSLKTIISNNTTSHSYIICSKDEVERQAVGHAFAKALMCNDFNDDACDKCISCITFDSLNNPDVQYITKDKKKNIIQVDTIRELVSDSALKPCSGNKKIYIIEEAELMNANAQNALLKTLEEPDEHTRLILLVGNMQGILPTILSRCVKITLNPLSKDEMILWSKRNGLEVDNTMMNYYINYASGNISTFLNIAGNEKFISTRNETLGYTSKMVSKDIDKIIEAKNYLINEKDNIDIVLDILETWFRDVMFVKNGLIDRVINQDKSDKLIKESSTVSLNTANCVIDNINKLRKLIENSANYKLAISVFLINVNEV